MNNQSSVETQKIINYYSKAQESYQAWGEYPDMPGIYALHHGYYPDNETALSVQPDSAVAEAAERKALNYTEQLSRTGNRVGFSLGLLLWPKWGTISLLKTRGWITAKRGREGPSSEVEAIRAGAVKNYSDSISNDEVRIITRVTTKGKGQTVRK